MNMKPLIHKGSDCGQVYFQGITLGKSESTAIVAFLTKKSAALEHMDKFIARGFLRHQLITGLLGKSRKVAQ